MANVKNFGLVGVGTNIQFGKAGPTLSKQGTTVLRADGTGAFMVPLGDDSARPTGSTGMIRMNNQSTPVVEYYNGTTWTTLATGGAAVTSVNGTLNRVTSSNTGAGSTIIDIDTNYVGQASITTLGTVGTGTWQGSVVGPTYGGTGVNNGSSTITLGGSLTTVGANTMSITTTGATAVTMPTSGTLLSTANIAANAVTSIDFTGTGLTPAAVSTGAVTVAGTLNATHGGTGVSSFALGDVLYASATNVWSAGAKGSVSGVQAWDTDLDALAGLATTGIIVRTGSGTATTRTITGTATRIVVTDGTGVAGEPTIDLATVTNPGTGGSFVKVTTDAYGRVTDSSAVVAGDITGLVDGTYVNASGDTMTGNLNMGTNFVTMNNVPTSDTQAANKAYVDSVAAGLSWKQAVHLATTANVLGVYDNGTAGVGATITTGQTALLIDSEAVLDGERVLVKDQVNGSVAALDTLTGGSGYNTPGTYNGVALTGGSGTGATANITVAAGAVTSVVLVSGGSGYLDNESLSAAAGNIGGLTPGSAFSILVNTVGSTAYNGIYVASGVGSNVVLTRAVNMDTAGEFFGAAVLVTSGTINDNSGWTQTEIVTTVGTSPNLWVAFSGGNTYVWGDGLGNSGNTVFVKVGAGITILPADEVGIDVASAKAVQLTGGATGDQLTFVLDGAGLEQSASGLKISAAGVTNAMLVNSGFAATADSGSETLTLGDTLHIVGNSTQGTSVAVTESPAGTIRYAVTAADASASQKGVATFDVGDFTVTSGNVVLNDINLATGVTGTLPVANGGTGATSFTATAVLLGDGTNPITTDALLTFVTATNTLTVGTSTISAVDGGDLTITATASNADINLLPNGTGAVVIGPAGAGLIQSDAANTLTVSGDTGLTLRADTSGDIVMDVANSTSYKVTVAGPSAADYATGLANEDLVNKYYVDTVAGSAAGDVKAFKQIVPLNANGTTNIGTILPTGATVLSVKVNVTTADTGATLAVGISGTPDAYMSTAENDPQTVGLYLAECMVVNSAVQIIATVASSAATSGSTCTVVVTYQIAN